MDILNKLLNSIDSNTNDKSNFVDIFKLPIELIDNKMTINSNILNDLELKEFKEFKEFKEIDNCSDISDNIDELSKENLYYSVLNPQNIFEKSICDRWSKYYSSDIDYLKNTQELLKNFKNNVTFNEIHDISDTNNLYNNCEEIIYDNGFTEKYQYIDIPLFTKYNNNEVCMQALSIYNLSSPLINLAIPIIFMILPFFIIKLQGHDITLESYILHLKTLFSQHIIGQFFSEFYESSISTKIYLLASFLFYIFQIYNNIISCGKYYKNIKFIHERLFCIRDYITNSVNNFNNLLKYTKSLITYENFNKTIEYNIDILNKYLFSLSKIKNYKLNFSKIFELGHLMKCFYKLNNDQNIIKSLYFSFGCNGFIQNITTIQKHVKNNNINYCSFIDKDSTDKTKFINSYYGELIRDKTNKIVKNSYVFDNNMILTGPNAAGKTTLLKSTIFNIILCQQLGCGFFDDAKVKLYDFIHCYINVPDTSGRDSLFQAEARRCKDILSCIEDNKDKTHFCVFDELYSGTNPEEAVESAYCYLTYLNKNDKVNYILTTHYYKLCKKLKNKISKNYHMLIDKNEYDNDFKFTYKIKKGISKIKGGLKVLKDLEYPENIIKSIENK